MGMLENKTGMVTGGGSGIGRATCLKFAAEGARVLVVDIDEQQGLETVAMIEAAQGEALFQAADVADERAVKTAIEAGIDRFGSLHVASNNAALSVGHTLLAETPADAFNTTYEVTLKGVFYCMKHQIGRAHV